MMSINNGKYRRLGIFSVLIVLILFLCCSVTGDDLYVSPSSGPPGTQISVSVSIYNDVASEYVDTYYGLEYSIVFDIRPADIINPNLWGWDNPIGTASIDYNGLLSGSATILLDAQPGTYDLFAAYQRTSDDPYHVYWFTTFTVVDGGYNNDRDGDGFSDDIDLFPDNPNEWSDYDGDGIGDNSDTSPFGDDVSNDDNTGSPSSGEGFFGLCLITPFFGILCFCVFIVYYKKK